MILEQVSDHEDQILPVGQFDESLCFVFFQDQGLLNIYVFISHKRFAGQGIVGFGWCGNHYAVNIFSCQDVV